MMFFNPNNQLTMRHDWCLVKRFPIPDTTKGGLHLPDSAIQFPQLAYIVAIGPKNPNQLQPSDVVLLPKYEGLRCEINHEDYYLFHIKQLLAVIYDFN